MNDARTLIQDAGSGIAYRAVGAADAVLFVTPEYNRSVPAVPLAPARTDPGLLAKSRPPGQLTVDC